jgi:hypothetical protein
LETSGSQLLTTVSAHLLSLPQTRSCSTSESVTFGL